MLKEKRLKHNYTSELELKSLLIRIKNQRNGLNDEKLNSKINKYINWHTQISRKKYTYPKKKNILKGKIKDKVIELSVICSIDETSYEKFGQIILLMIKNILRKPQFSGYTYKDDFYSDAIFKILKYLHNFDHEMISDITGQPVNAFAYISQIIHNSILYIINTKKKEQKNLRKQISMEYVNSNLSLKQSYYFDYEKEIPDPPIEKRTTKEIFLKNNISSLLDEIQQVDLSEENINIYKVYYPDTYQITFDEYNQLKPFLKGKISIIRYEVSDDI